MELILNYLKQCPVCQCEFMTNSKTRRTCSSPCARVLEHAGWWFNTDEYAESRLALAQFIVNHPEQHKRNKIRWAHKIVNHYLKTGYVAAPHYRYLQPRSKARRVMEEVLGPELIEEIIQRATRETADTS